MAQHTPGPWNTRDDDPCIVRAPGYSYLAEPLVDDLEESRANARLIAAAPRLMAACEALIKTDNLQLAIDLAIEALAQVEGQS